MTELATKIGGTLPLMGLASLGHPADVKMKAQTMIEMNGLAPEGKRMPVSLHPFLRSWLVCLWIIGFSLGCRPARPNVEMAQEEILNVMRSRILAEPALFERTEYNPASEMIAEKWIDPSIRRGIEQRNFGRWPTTETEAQRLAFSLKESAWRSVLDAPEGRTLIEKQMLSYWENPKVQLTPQGDSVEMDLGVTPGSIELTSRGYYSIQKSEFEIDGALLPSEFVRRLKSLRASYPNADRWRVTVVIRPWIERQHPVTYEYRKQEDRLFVYSHQEVYYSPSRLEGNLDRLIEGESPFQTRAMKLLPKERVGKPFVLD